MKEKIAFFLPSMRGGGVEKVMLNLAKDLVYRKNVNVDLVLVNSVGPYLAEVPKEINVIDLKSSRALFSFFKYYKYVTIHKPDAIISSFSHLNILSILVKLLSLYNPKLIVSIHTTISKSKKKVSWLRKRIIRNLYPVADHIVAVSSGVAKDFEYFIGVNIEKIKVIYNPVITNDIRYKKNELIEDAWFLEDKRPFILSVGRLNEAKNYDYLLRAFKIVKKTIDIKLIILGEGELRGELESSIEKLGLENDVYLPGFVSNPYKFMKQSSLFVLSSKLEGLPTVLIEALECETKVISTDCPSGPAEILKGGELGKLVPLNNEEIFAEEILVHLKEKQVDADQSLNDYKVESVSSRYYSLLNEGKKDV